MPRIRSIKPEFWKSEKLAKRLPGPDGRMARTLFIGIWGLAEDKTGVARANPAYLKAELFPYDEDVTAADVALWLGLLRRGRFIVCYEREDQSYLWVRGFLEHQRIDHPAKPSLPEPTEDEVRAALDGSYGNLLNPLDSRNPREASRNPREASEHSPQGAGSREQGGGAGSRERGEIAPGKAVRALEVFEHWQQQLGKTPRPPTEDQKTVIVQRLLDGFSPDELKKAVDGLANSKFHRDKGHTALKYALGSRDSVERCIHWADNPPDAEPAPPRPPGFGPDPRIIAVHCGEPGCLSVVHMASDADLPVFCPRHRLEEARHAS